jgi:hypothetical protein
LTSKGIAKLLATGKFDVNRIKNPSKWLLEEYGKQKDIPYEHVRFPTFDMLKKSLTQYARVTKNKVPKGLSKQTIEVVKKYIEDNKIDYDDLVTINNALVDHELTKKYYPDVKARWKRQYIKGRKKTDILDGR